MTCPLGAEGEAGLRERLARIEEAATHAREIASKQADDIGRILERLDMQEMRIERNERSIWELSRSLTGLRDALHTAKRGLDALMRDQDQRRTVIAVGKYAGAGVLLTLVLTGQITAIQATLMRNLFGLP